MKMNGGEQVTLILYFLTLPMNIETNLLLLRKRGSIWDMFSSKKEVKKHEEASETDPLLEDEPVAEDNRCGSVVLDSFLVYSCSLNFCSSTYASASLLSCFYCMHALLYA